MHINAAKRLPHDICDDRSILRVRHNLERKHLISRAVQASIVVHGHFRGRYIQPLEPVSDSVTCNMAQFKCRLVIDSLLNGVHQVSRSPRGRPFRNDCRETRQGVRALPEGNHTLLSRLTLQLLRCCTCRHHKGHIFKFLQDLRCIEVTAGNHCIICRSSAVSNCRNQGKQH